MSELDRQAARRLRWFTSPITADGLDFSSATLNTCFNAADRHVAAGLADEIALSGRSADTGEWIELDFAEVTARSAKLAGILRALEVAAGDVVLLRLPDSVERVLGMLAAARLGASFLICERGDGDERDDERGGGDSHQGGTLESALAASRAVLSDRPVGHGRCVRVAGRGGTDEFDYRALMRSSAVQPAECVDVPAGAALRVRSDATSPRPRQVCDNGRHAVELIRALDDGLDPSGAVEQHPCLAFAPLLLGRRADLSAG